MATFDSGARMDAGFRFDEVIPVGKHQNTMPVYKLEISQKNPAAKIVMANTHEAALTGNTFYPADEHMPEDAEFTAKRDALVAAEADVAAKKTAWKQAIAARDTADAELGEALTARASYCEAAQRGNPEGLASAGLPMRTPPQSVGALPAPGSFLAEMGDLDGEIDLSWDTVYGASSYEVQCKEHVDTAQWQTVKVLTQSKVTIPGLVSGKSYAFRGRAIGTNGEGPWSDETVKMAP